MFWRTKLMQQFDCVSSLWSTTDKKPSFVMYYVVYWYGRIKTAHYTNNKIAVNMWKIHVYKMVLMLILNFIFKSYF